MKKPKPAKVKCDPRHVAAARELRDRYLEHVNDAAVMIAPAGKYDVSRSLAAGVQPILLPSPRPMLAAG